MPATSAADSGTLLADNATQILAVLARFDAVFAVLDDRDAEITRAALEWAEREGRIGEASPELVATLASPMPPSTRWSPSAPTPRRPATSPAPTPSATTCSAKGILLEDTKDGVRWKRK